jgi:hypothetical protein
MVPLTCRRRRQIPSIAYILLIIKVATCTACRTSSFATSMNIAKPIHAPVRRRIVIIPPTTTITQLHFFHDLVLDDDEDLRTDIVTIDDQAGLESFLRYDTRLCVIKFYAPFCKACNIFRTKFHKLAFDRGDRRNTIGDVVHTGDVRFGQVEYSSKNVKLCKSLSITTFPSVLIFRGGENNTTSGGGGNTLRLPLSEIVCKQTAIDDIIAEINHLITYPTVESKVKYS